MGKTKSRANGDGDVFPRKNKAGKITSYRGAYFGPDGKRRYVSGKTKEEARKALRRPAPVRTRATSSTPRGSPCPSTWTAGSRTLCGVASGRAPTSPTDARRRA